MMWVSIARTPSLREVSIQILRMVFHSQSNELESRTEAAGLPRNRDRRR